MYSELKKTTATADLQDTGRSIASGSRVKLGKEIKKGSSMNMCSGTIKCAKLNVR